MPISRTMNTLFYQAFFLAAYQGWFLIFVSVSPPSVSWPCPYLSCRPYLHCVSSFPLSLVFSQRRASPENLTQISQQSKNECTNFLLQKLTSSSPQAQRHRSEKRILFIEEAPALDFQMLKTIYRCFLVAFFISPIHNFDAGFRRKLKALSL